MLFGRMPGDESLGRTPLVTALPALAGGAPFFNSRFSGQRLQPYGGPVVAAYQGGLVPQLSSVSPVAAASAGPTASASPAAAAAPDWLVGRDRERRIARSAGATGTRGIAEKGSAGPDEQSDRDYYGLAKSLGNVLNSDLVDKLGFDGTEYVRLAGLLLQEIAKWAQTDTAGKTAEAKPGDQSDAPKKPALPETVPVSWAGLGTQRSRGGFGSNPPSLSPTGPKAAPIAPRPPQARRPSYSLLV